MSPTSHYSPRQIGVLVLFDICSAIALAFLLGSVAALVFMLGISLGIFLGAGAPR
jgi:hypothetical protein